MVLFSNTIEGKDVTLVTIVGINVRRCSRTCVLFLPDLNETRFFSKGLLKRANIKFHGSLLCGSRVIPCVWTASWIDVSDLLMPSNLPKLYAVCICQSLCAQYWVNYVEQSFLRSLYSLMS
jgi:hypothetical protein